MGPWWVGLSLSAFDPIPHSSGELGWGAWPGPKGRGARNSGSENFWLFCSLQPPTPETDYPDLLTSYPEEDYSPVGSFSEPGPASPFVTPPGWSCHVSPDGQTVYTNNITEEQVGAAGRWVQTVVGSLPLPLYTEVPAWVPCQPKTPWGGVGLWRETFVPLSCELSGLTIPFPTVGEAGEPTWEDLLLQSR